MTNRRLRIRQTPPRPPQPPRPAPAPPAPAGLIRTWYRRTDWAKHTAVLAAAVAAASLALTAWGTYKAAQVADDQLTQSREKQDAEVRAQAARITLWKEPAALVLANRSLDPVMAYLGTFRYKLGEPVAVGTLPPCTAAKFPLNPKTGALEGKDLPLALHSTTLTLTFADAGGNLWQRYSSGELVRAAWYDGKAVPGHRAIYRPASSPDTLMELSEPKFRPLEECGAAAD